MKTTQILTAAITAFGLTTGALAQGQGRNNGNQGTQGGNAASTTTAAAAATSSAAVGGNNNAGGNAGSNNAQGGNDLLLLQSNVQLASDTPGAANATAGQSASNTDPANFINHCTGKTTTNGTQNTAGSCNGVVMGDIPSNQNMISSIILFPGPGDDIAPNTEFTAKMQITNLNAGVFTDPLATYYAAPQEIGSNGNIIGHCHVTIQSLGNSLTPTEGPDPKTFAFFKGIDTAGNGAGLLTADVTAGLPAGFYRICTMNSAANHQPVLMPVAQRGAQDDCNKFTVGQGGGAASGAASGASGNNASSGGSASTTAASSASTTAASGSQGNAGSGNAGGNAGSGAAVTTSAAAAAVTTTAASGSGSNSTSSGSTGFGRGGGGGRFGGGRGRYGRGRFAARDVIA